MIELPAWAVPNDAPAIALVDAGGTMRSPLNTAALRVNRPGSHYRATLTFAPMEPREGRIVVSRLIRAQREGLRIEFPLPEPQPLGGAVVIDGAGQSGLALAVRGMTPRTVVREGWWLSIEPEAGPRCLHNVAGEVIAGADGRAILLLGEMLRAPFADGTRVNLVRPTIEGLVDGDAREWALSVDQLTTIGFTIEEAR